MKTIIGKTCSVIHDFLAPLRLIINYIPNGLLYGIVCGENITSCRLKYIRGATSDILK